MLWPTWKGWLCLAIISLLTGLLVVSNLGRFLCFTGKAPAEVLVVEGWVQRGSMADALREFQLGNYQYLVTVGSGSQGFWEGKKGWSYAVLSGNELVHLGLPKERLIVAPAASTEQNRTYESAIAAREKLKEAGITVHGINVFTLGYHARRSRLVFQKVFGSNVKVGAVPWISPEMARLNWWQSSELAREVITEFAGWVHERFFGFLIKRNGEEKSEGRGQRSEVGRELKLRTEDRGRRTAEEPKSEVGGQK